MMTGPAIRTYNIMIGERRRVAAALIAVPMIKSPIRKRRTALIAVP